MEIQSYQGIDLRLGSAASEPISESRFGLWGWLASKVLAQEEALILNLSAPYTMYINEATIETETKLVDDLVVKCIVRQSEKYRVRLAIIDVSKTDYMLLRESVLFNLSNACLKVAAAELVDWILILLPEMLPSSSLFWKPLRGSKFKTIVVASNGKSKAMGAAKALFDIPEFEKDCRERFLSLRPTPEAMLERKLIRRLGHFDQFGNIQATCSRYFWDGSMAIEEAASSLTSQILNSIADGRIAGPKFIAVNAPKSPWMKEIAHAIVCDLNLNPNALLDLSTLDLSGNVDFDKGNTLLLADLVHTGSTLIATANMLFEAGFGVESVVFSLMSSGSTANVSGKFGTLDIESSCRVIPRLYLAVDCPLCKMGVPKHDFAGDAGSDRIASFDMWEMLLSSDWVREDPVPPEMSPFVKTPDLRAVFESYGDWVSFLFSRALLSLKVYGIGDEIVLVCPAESGAESLVRRLKSLLGSRITAVFLPRASIGSSREQIDSLGASSFDPQQIWYMQLLHLEDQKIGVVVIDEFNASGGTVRGIFRTLSVMGVTPLAYMCFLDRAPMSLDDLDVPTLSLYQFPSARGYI